MKPLQSSVASPVPKALRLLGVTALPTAIALPSSPVGAPLPSPSLTAAAGALGGGGGSDRGPSSPSSILSPSAVSSPRSSSVLPAPGSLADAASKSQLHAVAAPSPSKGTPVQTASSVLKSVPLLTSYNPARSSGGLAVIMGASSPTNAQLHGSGMDSPVSGGGGGGGGLRKRSSTEVSRPNRRSGGLAGIAAGHMHLPPCSPRSNGAAMSGAAAAAARAPGGVMSPGGSGGGDGDGLAHARTLSIAEDEPPLDLSATSTA